MHFREQQFLNMIFTDPELGRGHGDLNLSDYFANHYYKAIQNPNIHNMFAAAEEMEVSDCELAEYTSKYAMCGYTQKDIPLIIEHVKTNTLFNNFMSEFNESGQVLSEEKDKVSAVNIVLEKLIKAVQVSQLNSRDDMKGCVIDAMEYMQALSEGRIDKGLMFGISDVDNLVDGCGRGDLIVIAGRSGSGKTAAGLQFCINQIYQKKRGIFFSLEMPKRNLIMRMTANLAEMPLSKVKSGELFDDKAVTDKMVFLAHMGDMLLIDDKGSKKISEICNDARVVNMKTPIDYIMIDYAQLITDDISKNRNISKTESIGQITKTLKSLAKELDIPVILLAQVRRDVDGRPLGGWMGKPSRADISDSKEIENDCDALITLYNPSRYEAHKDVSELQGAVMWGLVKNRDGEEGEAWVDFNGAFQKMSQRTHPFNYNPLQQMNDKRKRANQYL